MNPKKRILHLTIKYKWFVEIAEGRKPYEFRETKPYWIRRLVNQMDGTFKEFDEIWIRNGYTQDRPFMRLRWRGILGERVTHDGKRWYAIDVGDIIEIKNYPRELLKTLKRGDPLLVHQNQIDSDEGSIKNRSRRNE